MSKKICGQCKYAVFPIVEKEKGKEIGIPTEGDCHFNPPLATPGQAQHPITGQVAMTVLSYRPKIGYESVACSRLVYNTH